MIKSHPWSTTVTCALALAMLTCHPAHADDIRYRSFSASAAIGPPAAAFASKLDRVTGAALGEAGRVRFVPLPGIPAIPTPFHGSIVAAVAAGESAGGFDAAYISGGDLNPAWGFLFNSGVPLGPSFDEFTGFLYGPIDDTRSVLDLVQEIELRQRGVMAVPIVGSPEQLSGYFLEPVGPAAGRPGIGLAGLCEQRWALRYLPPGEDVLNLACDQLVREGRIRAKNLSFVEAVPGGGSLVDAVVAGAIQGFEFATPLDDVSQLFSGKENPGTLGLRYVHAPGWQQQFLLTWMIVNRARWDALGPARQLLVQTVARDHVLTSYADNLRQQGPALSLLLGANQKNGRRGEAMTLVPWPTRDLARLRDATIRFLNRRTLDTSLSSADRADYTRFLRALRAYVHANDRYWDHRQVDPQLRFEGWVDDAGRCWSDPCDVGHGEEHAER
jgi:hypothetical protein